MTGFNGQNSMFNTLRSGIFRLAIGCCLLVKADGADVKEMRAYGPGGPLDPITECAQAFSNQEGVHVTVTGGPEEEWIGQARKDAFCYWPRQLSWKHQPFGLNFGVIQKITWDV
jgi:hypothetical protein